jgi:hypothetical protein
MELVEEKALCIANANSKDIGADEMQDLKAKRIQRFAVGLPDQNYRR